MKGERIIMKYVTISKDLQQSVNKKYEVDATKQKYMCNKQTHLVWLKTSITVLKHSEELYLQNALVKVVLLYIMFYIFSIIYSKYVQLISI